MRIGDWRLEILDPRLFWRKLVLLLVFSAAFIPLKAYNLQLPLNLYILFLLILHVYFVFVFAYRVRWRVLAADRRAFAVRLMAVALFVALLVANNVGATLGEFILFLVVSLVIHTGLLLSLTMVARRSAASPTAAQ